MSKYYFYALQPEPSAYLQGLGAMFATAERQVEYADLSHLEDDFQKADGLVFACAAGIVLRKLAPLLQSKDRDPAVILVDWQSGSFIPLLSGHLGGANALAKELAAIAEGRALLTTATDQRQLPAVDDWARELGATLTPLSGILPIAKAQLATGRVQLYSDAPRSALPSGYTLGVAPYEAWRGTDWPDACPSPEGPWLWLSERPFPGLGLQPTLWLIPKTLVLGAGCRKDYPVERFARGVAAFLAELGVDPRALAILSSHERKAEEMALIAFAKAHALPFYTHSAEELKALCAGHPEWTTSDFVEAQVGTPAVAQPAAAAHGAGELLAEERGEGMTLALFRRGPELSAEARRGEIIVCGYGPGAYALMTREAQQAFAEADLIATYKLYAEELKQYWPTKRYLTTVMTEEKKRCELAIEAALAGEKVVLASNGDAGVYGMASLVLELLEKGGHLDLPWRVIPGVTAATAAAARLGAPLSHDFALISLSDRLTPWPLIQKRLRLAAEADLVICLYNPRSKGRPHFLQAALELVQATRPEPLVIGLARHIGRPEESLWTGTLADFEPERVDMHSLVIIGNSQTYLAHGRMITPRGYKVTEED